MPEPTIVIDHLTKRFGRTTAVNDVSLTVQAGEVFGFLGPNGAGKTTTIRCMMDFYRPTAGSIRLMGLDANTEGVLSRKHVGFMPPVTALNEKWTSCEHFDYARALRKAHDRSAELVQRLEIDTTKTIKQLSSGNRQKVSLAMAFMFTTDVVILDEPTNGLDPLLQQTAYELIHEAHQRGATIFMSSHNLAEVERTCTRVGILRNGNLIAQETMLSLQEKHLYTVQLWFNHDVAPASIMLPNATVIVAQPRTVTLKYQGVMQPLLDSIARLKPYDVSINHATLEEHFMTFYNHQV